MSSSPSSNPNVSPGSGNQVAAQTSADFSHSSGLFVSSAASQASLDMSQFPVSPSADAATQTSPGAARSPGPFVAPAAARPTYVDRGCQPVNSLPRVDGARRCVRVHNALINNPRPAAAVNAVAAPVAPPVASVNAVAPSAVPASINTSSGATSTDAVQEVPEDDDEEYDEYWEIVDNLTDQDYGEQRWEGLSDLLEVSGETTSSRVCFECLYL
ncbi:hypothetical protein F5Y15DRAFT_419401 [Xylariaceae sp. FL0016]|nr:hypothetical protein F5Y15DRAFT_419401 [Xylariaceae sp. FL0016]